jgi:hypothetical protein
MDGAGLCPFPSPEIFIELSHHAMPLSHWKGSHYDLMTSKSHNCVLPFRVEWKITLKGRNVGAEMPEVTLPTLRFERPTLSREERITAYLREDAELKSQIERLNAKRADLKGLLQEIGEDAFELWYLQEHGDIMNGYRRKEMKRLERRAAMEDRERSVQELRARITPEAQAKLRASIAELKEKGEGKRKSSLLNLDGRKNADAQTPTPAYSTS